MACCSINRWNAALQLRRSHAGVYLLQLLLRFFLATPLRDKLSAKQFVSRRVYGKCALKSFTANFSFYLSPICREPLKFHNISMVSSRSAVLFFFSDCFRLTQLRLWIFKCGKCRSTMYQWMRRPGDTHLAERGVFKKIYIYLSPTGRHYFPFKLNSHLLGFTTRFYSPNTAACAISFHGDSVTEDFIICVGPIESDWPHWEGWKSTQ